MAVKLKISVFLIGFILGCPFMSGAQSIFYCDSIVSSDQRALVSECKLFYNLTTRSLDSVQVVDLELDTVYALPVRIIAPINNDKEIHGTVIGLSNTDTVFKVDYSRGMAQGTFIRYCKNDTLSISEYKSGKKNGFERSKTFCNSPDYIKTNYQEDVEIGPSVLMKNQRLSFLAGMSEGELNGAQYQLYDDGTLAWYLIFKAGRVVDGIYSRFDSDGKVVETRTYKRGKIRKSVKYFDDEPPKITRYK